MAKCTFCKYMIEPGTGTMYVKTDGTILWFCTMKCEKNMLKLEHTPRLVKWTKAYEKGGATPLVTKKPKATGEAK